MERGCKTSGCRRVSYRCAYREGELQFQIKDVLTQEQLEAAASRLEMEEGDLALICAGAAPTAATALGAIRTTVAKELV